MAKVGPFFYLRGKLIFHSCPLEDARQQADKLDNSYSHEKLYDDHFRFGDYIDYPRGRVIWDLTHKRAIIYIDPCINTAEIVSKIIEAYDLSDYITATDEHYHCKKCSDSIFL